MQWNKIPCAYLDTKVRAVQNQEQTQEVRLPEGMPDIGRVLCAWGQPVLRSKEWRGDSMVVSGGVTGFVLFEPEDGAAPQMVQCWLPFQAKWSFPESKHEGTIRTRCLLKSIDARTLSARKLMVRSTVGLLGEALEPASVEIPQLEAVPEDVQVLTNTYPLQLPSEAGEKLITLDETVDLPEATQLIAWDMDPVVGEETVVGQRAVFKGAAKLHLVYMDANGRILSGYYDLPFAQYAELDKDHDKEATVSTMLAVSNLEPELTDGVLAVKAGLIVQYLVHDRQLLQLVQDAYSPYRPVEATVEMLTLPVLLEQLQRPLEAQGGMDHPITQVADMVLLPEHPLQYRQEGKIHLEIPGLLQTLGYDQEGKLQVHTESWMGVMELPAGDQCSICANVVHGNGSQLQVQLQSVAQQSFPMVTDLQLGAEIEPDPDRPSLILCRAEDGDLWSIAKECGSTVEAIRKANGFSAEPVPGQMLLIPVV